MCSVLFVKEPHLAEKVGQALGEKNFGRKARYCGGTCHWSIIIAYEVARSLGVPGILLSGKMAK